ncbi:MAG: hypothetical protein GX927_08495 [Lentisphaerae bacterium]|nr:hypothetical protein [Lentisphaerota bacterium]
MMSNLHFKIILVLLAFMLLHPLAAQEKCRGNFLRTEIRKTETREQYDCALKTVTTSFPCLHFKRQMHFTYHETRIYEALERIVTEGDSNAPKTTGSSQYRLLPGEFWEGESSVRTEIKEAGPFVNETFLINGKAMQTDAEGNIFADTQSGLDILEFFDNLNTRQLDLEIEHVMLGTRKLTLFRTMPRRAKTDEKNLDEDTTNDILVAFNLDFYQRMTEPERQKLKVEYFLNTPEIEPGKPFTMIIKVSNQGARDTSCLIGRTFSREPWLNGKLFYFGAIAPGATQIFSRTFQPDAGLKVDRCFAALAFSDSWGELPQHQLNLKIPVEK